MSSHKNVRPHYSQPTDLSFTKRDIIDQKGPLFAKIKVISTRFLVLQLLDTNRNSRLSTFSPFKRQTRTVSIYHLNRSWQYPQYSFSPFTQDRFSILLSTNKRLSGKDLTVPTSLKNWQRQEVLVCWVHFKLYQSENKLWLVESTLICTHPGSFPILC